MKVICNGINIPSGRFYLFAGKCEKTFIVSLKFYNFALINFGDISQDKLTSDEQSMYCKIGSMMIEKRLQRYADEAELLFSAVDENNPSELALLQQIADYPQIL